MKKGDKKAITSFIVAIIITLLIHYFLISQFNLHSTIHVIISLILLWVILGIISLITNKKKK